MRNKSRDVSNNSQKVQDIIIETKLRCQIYSLWIQSYLQRRYFGPPFRAFLAVDPWKSRVPSLGSNPKKTHPFGQSDPTFSSHPRPGTPAEPHGAGMQPLTNPVQVASVRLGRSERLIFAYGNSRQIPPLPVVSFFFKWSSNGISHGSSISGLFVSR